MNDHKNSYRDSFITMTQNENNPILSDREPFNDVERHLDIINGYQRAKILSTYPRKIRTLIRIIIIMVLCFMALLFLGVFRLLI